MKIAKYIFFLSGILLITSCRVSPKAEIPTETILNYSPSESKVQVSAHRAGKGESGYPENCLETIQHFYSKGIRIFEVDIMESSDGVLMLYHDDQLGRTSEGSGKFVNHSFDQLRSYHLIDDDGLKTDFFIPVLDEVLKWAVDHKDVIFMWDVKRGIDHAKVIDLIQQYQLMQQSVMITYSINTAQRIYELEPRLKLSVSIRNEAELNKALESGIPTENMIAFTGTRASSPDLYDMIHQNGMLAILGTLGNLDKRAEARGERIYQEFIEMGVDVFATDRPLAVQEVINKQ